ncbi:hypothetical protein RvY_02549 [Ramazzottius varieornatus]|uniref:Translationally-controlled tumor protein homolog n=1 Tax=Ramazzottius varieornatus TaxID=947166 RepID=A0A1D1US52_RAMVA|nr:hypothetical protein RvY_02549 [Ramazzottius varieornatus]
MKIYKDLLTGDEMFTDSYPMKLVDDCIYEVTGKHVTRKVGDIVLAGANPSAEEADEGTEDAAESGVDIVLNQRLSEIGFLQDKKQFQGWLKDYMKLLSKKLEEQSPDKVADFKKRIQPAVVKLMQRHGDFQFFTGESMNAAEGMVAMCEYRNIGGVDTPIMSFFKDGLIEEKV